MFVAKSFIARFTGLVVFLPVVFIAADLLTSRARPPWFSMAANPLALESLGGLAVLLLGSLPVLLRFLLALEFFVLLKAKVNHRAPS